MTVNERTRGRIPSNEIAARRAALLATAREAFMEHGFERATVEGIARSAHVSPKTIYAAFGGKDGLFIESMKTVAAELLAPLEADVREAAELEYALATFGERLLIKTLSPGARRFQRLLMSESARFPSLTQAFYANGPGRALAMLAAVIERAQRAGIVAGPPAVEAGEAFMGALQGELLRRALLFDETLPADALRERAQRTARLFMAALRAEPPASGDPYSAAGGGP